MIYKALSRIFKELSALSKIWCNSHQNQGDDICHFVVLAKMLQVVDWNQSANESWSHCFVFTGSSFQDITSSANDPPAVAPHLCSWHQFLKLFQRLNFPTFHPASKSSRSADIIAASSPQIFSSR